MATKRKRIESKIHNASAFNDRICNLVPSKDTQSDWSYSDVQGVALTAAPIPATLDLRKPWWTINNQENTGSCVGWAAADSLLRYQLVVANRLQKSELLSPRFVWMASKETDEFVSRPETFIEAAGTSLKASLDVLRRYGCVLDSELPFGIRTLMYADNPNTFFASASTRKIANYVNMRKNADEWKAWLFSVGPILVGLNVDATWRKAHQTGGNLDVFVPSTSGGGHAVCIVGYKNDRFIIRNSWGAEWGDNGFGYASPDYIAEAFFPESYGITL